MRFVGAFEAKTHLAALLDAVSDGEQITITRHVGNVFREGELPEPCNVHFLHAFGSDRPVLHRHLIQGLASHHQHVTLNWLATG